jgi:hypothetical protein
MFNKTYLSRAQTRAMSIDHPIGDPFGGAAYGELRDPVTAAISAGGSILGSLVGGAASKSAANTQADAAQAGMDAQTQAKNDQLAALRSSLDQQVAAAGGVLSPELKNAYDYLDKMSAVAENNWKQAQDTAGQTLNDRLLSAQGVYGQQQGWMTPVYDAGMAGQGRLLNYLGIGAGDGSGNFGKYANADFTAQNFLDNQDPGYGFRMSEGLKAVDRQAAARNGLISGAALKASQRYGQDMASQEYQNAFNRYQTSRTNTLSPLQQITAQGASAAGALGSYAQNYGNATQAAYGDFNNSIQNALGNYGNMLGGAYGTGAGLVNNAYANNANLTGAAYGTYGNNVAGVYGNYGTNLSNLYGAQGQANASGTVGMANALTGGLSNAANGYMQGQMLNSIARDQSGRSAWGDIDASNFMTSGAYPPGYRG